MKRSKLIGLAVVSSLLGTCGSAALAQIKAVSNVRFSGVPTTVGAAIQTRGTASNSISRLGSSNGLISLTSVLQAPSVMGPNAYLGEASVSAEAVQPAARIEAVNQIYVDMDVDGLLQSLSASGNAGGSSDFSGEKVKQEHAAVLPTLQKFGTVASMARIVNASNGAEVFDNRKSGASSSGIEVRGREMDGEDVIADILTAMGATGKTRMGNFEHLADWRRDNNVDGLLRDVRQILVGKDAAVIIGAEAWSQARRALARAEVGLLLQYAADRGDGGWSVSSEKISKNMIATMRRALVSTDISRIERNTHWFSLATDIREKSLDENYYRNPRRVVTARGALRKAARLSRDPSISGI